MKYFNEYNFELNDNLIAGILNDSVTAIKRFLADLRINDMYYDLFLIFANNHDAEISNDVAMIILDFLCHYHGINEHLELSSVLIYEFDVSSIENMVDELIVELRPMNEDVKDDAFCVDIYPSNAYRLLGEEIE